MTEARRIVVKVGSSSLTTAAGGLDADRVDALVDVLAKSRSGGEKEVVLVSLVALAGCDCLYSSAYSSRDIDAALKVAVGD